MLHRLKLYEIVDREPAHVRIEKAFIIAAMIYAFLLMIEALERWVLP